MTVALLAVIVVLVAVISWLLRPGPSRRRGSTLDLVPAAVRGELDLDWSDPRERAAQHARIATADAEHAELVADWKRHAGLTSESKMRFDVDQQAGAWFTVPLHSDTKSPILLTTSPSG